MDYYFQYKANVVHVFAEVVLFLQTNFEDAVIKGRVTTARLSAGINHLGQIVPPGSWATERFGHMACYYGKM